MGTTEPLSLRSSHQLYSLRVVPATVQEASSALKMLDPEACFGVRQCGTGTIFGREPLLRLKTLR